jgi:hypothetical protein
MPPNKKRIKKSQQIHSTTPNLSSVPNTIDNIENKLYDALNAVELKRSMDKWLKTNEGKNSIVMRDLTILKGIIEEYLNSFIVLGYTIEGERVILQSYGSPKDKDALMEFLKNVFIQQHQGIDGDYE